MQQAIISASLHIVAVIRGAWVTMGPFLFCARHDDHYPPGNRGMDLDKSEFLLLQVARIGEVVTQYGPFAINTTVELLTSFKDYWHPEVGGWCSESTDQFTQAKWAGSLGFLMLARAVRGREL
tara:strand:- start:127 stop:495 length:369 start_codon:yes stop_codon:yes gene_type:complete